LCGAGTWALRKVDHKCLESFEVWFWRRIEISWTYSETINELLKKVKEEKTS
jgi:hypothetical protein